jgi:hypothetical protein
VAAQLGAIAAGCSIGAITRKTAIKLCRGRQKSRSKINRSIAIVPAWAACGAVWLASAQARPSAGRGRCYRSYY